MTQPATTSAPRAEGDMTGHRALYPHSLRVRGGWVDIREGQVVPRGHLAVQAHPSWFTGTDMVAGTRTTSLLSAAPTRASARPRSLGILGRAPVEAQTGLHECAHAVVAELLGVEVGAVVRFGDGSGETRHDSTDGAPRERALVALAGVVVGDVAGWQDPHGISSDLAVAREAAAQSSSADPDGEFARLKAEATTMVRENLQAIGRCADVLERFAGRLAGWQLSEALDYALERPARMPTPGPRGHAAEVLGRFWADRRAWIQALADERADLDDLERFLEADRRARAMIPPPRIRPSTRPDPETATSVGASSDAGRGLPAEAEA